MAGLKGKDEDFWRRIKKWDVVGLVETWVEAKDWGKWKEKMPRGFKWVMQGAKKESRRRRAARRIVMRIKKGLEGKREIVAKEGLMLGEISWEGELWKVGTVYLRENIEKVLERIRREADKRKGEKGWIIERDFNARTGEEGVLEDRELGVKRRSLDKVINSQGEKLLKWVEEEEWGIMNGAKEGDKEREVTFIGERGESVIDYVLGDRSAWERVERLEVGGEINSDHRSVTVSLEGGIKDIRRKLGDGKEEDWVMKEDWSVGVEFGERTKDLELGKKGIDEELEGLTKNIY